MSIPAREIAALLQGCSAIEVLKTAAGLQLLPGHAHMLAQLEALAAGACACRPVGRRPTREELGQILCSELLCDGPIAWQDDPYEHHFTELFDFDEGPYLVFPGATTGGTSVLTSLAGGLRLGSEHLPRGFTREAHRLITSALRLADAVVKRAGLPRLTPPSGPHWLADGTVHPELPDPATLARIRVAVTFKQTELSALVGLVGARELLLHLGLKLGRLSPDAPAGQGNPLLLRPMVQSGQEVIVACPHALLAATVRAVVRLAQEHGVSEALTACVAQAGEQRTALALHRLGVSQLGIPLEASPLPGTRQSLHLLDAELLLHVVVLTEPVAEVNPAQWVGRWDLDLPDFRPNLPPDLPPHDLLTLVVVVHLGDAFRFSMAPAGRASTLLLELDDLETFATAHREEPLALYRLHQSQQALAGQVELLVSSPVELLAFCCQHGFVRSFPFEAGTPLLLGSAQAAEWRRGVKAASDRHIVPWLDGVSLLPVERAKDAPPGVYLPVVSPWSRRAMVVEYEGTAVWVLDGDGQNLVEGSEVGEPQEEDPDRPTGDVVQALAVWLPQLLPLLPELGRPALALMVHAQGDRSDPHFGLFADRKAGLAHLLLGQDFAEFLREPDNTAERHLLAAAHHVLSELVTGRPPTPEQTRAAVEHVAPRGDKRVIFSVPLGLNAELDPRNLTRPRLVQVAEWQAAQVVVGRTLASESGWTAGPVSRLDRKVMDKANGLLFDKLRGLLATCDGPALLEALLSLYEALRHDVAWLSHTGVTRQLAYGPYARRIEGRHHITSTALRFLIELVVAEPPAGRRPPSLLLVDELIATAVAIVDYGIAGDALQHGLGRVEAECGPDGALRVQAPEYAAASATQATLLLSRSMEANNAARYRHLEEAEETEPDWRLDCIDEVCRSLYGLTFRDLMGFLNEVQNIGDRFEGRNARLPLPEFLRVLRERSGWPLGKVLLALAPLVLTPRPDFLAPPEPYRPSDVFPWQFNRELSLARRPLLLVPGTAGEEIVWGNRVVEGAKQYWASSLFGDGRLSIPDRAAPLRPEASRALNRLREAAAVTFNAMVAEVAWRHGCEVRQNVRKIGKLRLVLDGGDLEDVDVLAVDRHRRRVWVIECKDYTVARTPVELASDVEALIWGKRRARGGRERALLERHQRRADFVASHLPEVLGEFGMTDEGF
ncbi:hypothetical protein QOL99_08785 [Deinococcus sp. MIMF12]|uniref:NERD domain-containing protein n=1 Tax=Deinococcus rhizophilus TaxID=3049544 RepID=A0ABT7JGQ9_9DEIO|nr:hypothetical protein [Deinococcus rhizophilus]MDL2344247.1 hypothetical protein [Deinococcus rhizophilus]